MRLTRALRVHAPLTGQKYSLPHRIWAEKKQEGSIMKQDIKAIVLAAGKGKRLRAEDDDAPKVMRRVCGKPMIWYVLDALSFVEKKDTIIVVGYKKDCITAYLAKKGGGYTFALQAEQLGTGHAVMAASDNLIGYTGALLVCYGDMPAIQGETYQMLLRKHVEGKNNCTLLSGISDNTMSYGRILRDENGVFCRVVEDKDCTDVEREIKELNTGVYVFDTPMLLKSLKELKNNNSQGEYYITDVPEIMKEHGARVGVYTANLGEEMIGVNTPADLDTVEKILRERSRFSAK